MAEIVSVRPSKPAVPRQGRMREPFDRGGNCGEVVPPPLWNKTIELLCGRPEALNIQARTIADAVLAEIAAPPVTVTQNGSARGDPHRFHLVVLLEGHGTYRWAAGERTQSAGDIVLIDTTEPSQVVSPVSSRLLRWSLPESLAAPFLPFHDRCDAILRLPAGGGMTGVLMRNACELAREAEGLDRTLQHGLLSHICGLLGLAMEVETRPHRARQGNYRAFQRQRVLAYIEAHLDDPRLTAGRAARDLGMSPRWLHALFEEMAAGFCDFVAGRRLEKGRTLLEDPASEHLSIAEIAFLCGFNDLSTFYRRFGERYSMTPGEVRRRGRRAA
ncbi:helix-turn-helix domain-containing protein [Chelativorans sp. AA-79]|uniref:helix-turn-helix domain-containing protein n=1 Tax=Chelativorans sp. AA-79 TaxID=3028735 RepID=UPI0023F7827E|nr:helix-turn-helix domain-containing protein [Chelativorans sp. AA-79]WEX08656.1 helix-turn-helix domain-containing protein [Chelativorans sp. AA-79]